MCTTLSSSLNFAAHFAFDFADLLGDLLVHRGLAKKQNKKKDGKLKTIYRWIFSRHILIFYIFICGRCAFLYWLANAHAHMLAFN